MRICKVKGCKNKIFSKKYCQRHYMQLWRYKKILKRTIFDKNKIIDCGDYYEICLYKKNQKVAKTKIDKDDLGKVKNYIWGLTTQGYVANKNKNIFLHQLILGKRNNFHIDHINHLPLDNRKRNLRHCTRSQNAMNRKAKGYYFDKQLNKWRVSIMLNKKTIHLGNFLNEWQAIIIRRQAEKKYFGEFRYNNLIN